ncbi:MAG TPA: sodium/glutamate symporter [Vicinamibacterales bacterium]|nr:sodium/glutamate symporter [Vicinamibacterales bacterium]
MLTFDQIETVALAGLVLFVGYAVRRLVPILARYNIPAPVIGGLLMAGFVTVAGSCSGRLSILRPPCRRH